jgi:N-acetylmuramoyl-L-alanine amidase
MYKELRLTTLITVFAICLILIFSGKINAAFETEEIEPSIPEAEVTHVTYIPEATVEMAVDISEEKPEEEEPAMSDKDIDLIALVTMAEAEGECEKGKRLVIDTILNRVDSDRFPNTVSGVIYQKNQFTSMWNGRADRCHVRKDIRKLVIEELKSRLNSDVIFFTAGQYGDYGTRMFRVGNHYFAKY